MKKSLFLSLSALSLMADISYDTDIRFRYEYFDGMNEKYYGNNPIIGENRDGYLLSRIRVGATYKASDDLTLRVSAQDAMAFDYSIKPKDWVNGEFNQKHNPQEDYLELYETYIQKNFSNLELKIGRQKMNFGDNRIFGPGEWKNSGKWVWDAIKATYNMDKNFISLFYGATMLHDEEEFSLNDRHGYYSYGLYSHFEFDKFNLEPMIFVKENTKNNKLYNSLKSNYVGLRTFGDVDKFGFNTTFIKSFGDFEKTNKNVVDIDGYGIVAVLDYKLNKNLKVGVEYNFASGDDPKPKERELFDSAFGASDMFYGRMNLMQFSNLMDYSLFAQMKFSEKFSSKLEYHRFYADEPTNKWFSYQISDIKNDYYGDEVDLVTTFDYSKNLSFQLGLGCFLAGNYIKEASSKNKNITDDDVFSTFVQLNYKFKG